MWLRFFLSLNPSREHDSWLIIEIMRRFPVVSTDSAINDRVLRVCQRFSGVYEPVFLDSIPQAVGYLRYELPDFHLIHFSDNAFSAVELIDTIVADPWLLYGGVIGVYSRKDSATVESLPRETNVVTMIRRGEFVESFFRVLLVLHRNRQILFHREMQLHFLGAINGSFEIDNDPYNARTYAALISNFLFNANYIDLERRDRLHVALFELIMNAIEHGNCGISYQEKTDYLAANGDILSLIRDKRRDEAIGKRRVGLTYRIEPSHSWFEISDEGEGFDWRARLKSEEVNLGQHGHGIRMTRHYISNLTYNEVGNVVSFEVEHIKVSNATPRIFSDQGVITLSVGEEVFREGEASNDLYYIISGRLGVYRGELHLATLTPDDIFIGEMSFLLGNTRSATVKALSAVQLVRITKNVFVTGIQRQPHYGIFLARLLAVRLSRLNRQVAERDEAHSR